MTWTSGKKYKVLPIFLKVVLHNLLFPPLDKFSGIIDVASLLHTTTLGEVENHEASICRCSLKCYSNFCALSLPRELPFEGRVTKDGITPSCKTNWQCWELFVHNNKSVDATCSCFSGVPVSSKSVMATMQP